MHSEKKTGDISLLQAFAISMAGIALLFIFLASGISVYTREVLESERRVISELLPELDAAYQLTAATAGLQSRAQLLLSTDSLAEINRRGSQFDVIITQSQKIIGLLPVHDSAIQAELESAVERLSELTTDLLDVKRQKFALREQIQSENQRVLAAFDELDSAVHDHVGHLTDELLSLSGQIAAQGNVENADFIAAHVLEFESTNLTIQDYLLFIQDVNSLSAVVDRLPLLTSRESLSDSIQRRDSLLRALVNRSIYVKDEASSELLLQPLRNLYDQLHGQDNAFDLQLSMLTLQERLASIGDLIYEPINAILTKVDLLRNESRSTVNQQAENTLASFDRFRYYLVAVSALALLILVAISYWLMYRETVKPLVQITRQLDDVGTDRYPVAVRPYLLRELTKLSAAMLQLHEAQKQTHRNELELQQINRTLQRANMELEQFAHVASHDLQEPLRKLQQFSDLLEEDYESRLDEDGRFYIASIRNAAQRMSNLISDTLAFSRAGSRKQTLEPVDLSDLLLQLLDEIDMAIAEAEGRVMIDALPTVNANQLGMAQLFRNLLTNAVKYRHQDRPAEVSVKVDASGNGRGLVITVQDNGVGIREEHLERIFQPFERLHTEGVRGTGLGLAICKKVCEAHDWELEVTSEPGVGTTFLIHIPPSSLLPESKAAS